MDTKLDGILSTDDKDIIVGMLSVIDLPEKQKLNLIESVITAIHIPRFTRLEEKEKLEVITFITLIFDSFLDPKINPLARKYFLKGLACYNNNVCFDLKGGAGNV